VSLSFTYSAWPGRVVFAEGALAKLSEEVRRLGLRRVALIVTPSKKEQGSALAIELGERCVAIHAKAVVHVPIEAASQARNELRRMNADGIVALGGGSAIGLAKAVALELDLPIIAVPTTYAGSEMTPIWGITEGGMKRTGRDARVLPRTVIYDPSLLLGLTPDVTAPSGINALAHCVEALYALDANPLIAAMAEEGLRRMARSLPTAVRHPGDLPARAETLCAAWLAGTCLGAVAMALHHKLCHSLGGSFNLPHGEVHAAILPHAAAYNERAAPEAMARIARALGAAEGVGAPAALFDLAQSCGAKMRLADIGMREADLDRATEIALAEPYPNPRPLDFIGIRKLLGDAYFGRRPRSCGPEDARHASR
jgi:maleylacetate reductase